MKRQRRWMAGLLAILMVVGAVLTSACTDQKSGFNVLIREIEADTIRYAQGTVNYQVAVIERDGKYGLINYDGEIVVPTEFEPIELGVPYYDAGVSMLTTWVFDGEVDGVTFEADGSVSDIETYAYGYEPEATPYWYNGKFTSFSVATELGYEESWHPKYNLLGTVVLERQPVIAVQEISGFTTNEYGEQEAVLVSGRYALMDYKTKTLITDFIYDDCSSIGFVDGVLPVQKDGKWGYVNEKGVMLTEFVYDASEISDDGRWSPVRLYASTNGYTVVRQGDGWGLIDNAGKEIVPPIYEDISQVNDKGQFWLKKNGTWSLAELIV